MADIRSSRRGRTTVVVVSGDLASADVGTLEHACAPALTTPVADLEIDLRCVTSLDPTAACLLVSLRRRGARLDGGAGPQRWH
jgi:hypothetical protein